MFRAMVPLITSLCLVTALIAASPVAAETMKGERAEHPRIAKAIHELEGAIQYMEAAPHDFGGHKADAIRDSRQAIEQLRKALAYRERADNRKGK
jgi:hypothetical protein